ncbi:MAG: tripartite tricarboxylate transporter TctB family protein [Rubrivivax sp.]
MTPRRVALLLVLLCGVAAWQVLVIPESAIQMAVGPSLVPAVIVGLLGLTSAIYAISAWRGRQVDESLAEGAQPLTGAAARLAFLVAGGLVFMAGVSLAGFVVPAALCGMCIARAFDAPLDWKSALICSAIALVFWSLFSLVLGVSLGHAWRGLGPAT